MVRVYGRRPKLKRQGGESHQAKAKMVRVYGRRPKLKRQRGESQFEELNRPEKKRAGGGSQFEEETDRVVEEAYDCDSEDANFNEDDSDDDNGDDYTRLYKTIETGFWCGEPDVCLDDNGVRKCNEVPLCDKFQHNSTFRASPVFELYKVKLILNEELSTLVSGKLYGVIYTNTSPESPDPVYYYRVRKENAVHITLSPDNNVAYLTLSGPETSPPAACCYHLQVNFAFKFENSDGTIIDVFDEFDSLDEVADAEVFNDGHGKHTAKCAYLSFSPRSVGPGRELFCTINRKVLGSVGSDAITVAAYYGAYTGAWATVDVSISKGGVSRFYGFISARSCIFYSKTRLLSLQRNEMRELQANKSVELTRRVVVVPSFSTLIIAALLYDQHGNLIVRGKALFPASEKGTMSRSIGNGSIKIEVTWGCRTL